jgi:hypothetical protein
MRADTDKRAFITKRAKNRESDRQNELIRDQAVLSAKQQLIQVQADIAFEAAFESNDSSSGLIVLNRAHDGNRARQRQ